MALLPIKIVTYKELFINPEENTENSKRAKEVREIIFNSIKQLAEIETPKEHITRDEIIKAIKELKNKYTRDSQGWSNVLLKNSGMDVVNSIEILFNEIDRKIITPREWIEMIIISLYKNKGSKEDMENRRGLFITSTISKVYEKIKQKRNNEEFEKKVSKYQCGGRKEKSTIDHILTLNTIIDYNKYINSETYILFADAYKCFDRLNLKECINEYYKIVGAREAIQIYEMNKKGKAVVKTPMGETEPIEVNEVVRQGTITGPKLCSNDTDKVNKIGHKQITTIGPNIKVRTLAYVDDLQNASSSRIGLKATAENLRTMEEIKTYTFNTEPNKTAILIINKKKNREYNDIKMSLKGGEIKLTNEYKYLGEWYNEKGDHSTSIKKRESKIGLYIKQIKVYGNDYLLRNYTLDARLKLYNTIVIPSLYYNIEAWSHITKKEMSQLESMQYRILREITEQKAHTPYQGLLAELGIWPVERQIEIKKIMLLNSIMNSKKERLVKDIIAEQINSPWKNCWVEQVKMVAEKYRIDINEVISTKRTQLKHKVKKKIQEHLDIITRETVATKQRFIKEFKKKEYITNMEFKYSKLMLKIRLNMIEVKCNYKNKFKTNLICEMCKKEEDTTEHLLRCEAHPLKGTLDTKDIEIGEIRVPKVIEKILSIRKELGFEIEI